jgi:hypothetical protein
MKNIFVLAAIFLTVFFYSLHIVFFELVPKSTDISTPQSLGYYDYQGLTHVHSNLSTGSSSPEEIIEVAKDIPLDFMFLNEVNLPERRNSLEGYYEGLLVLTGGEYSYLDSRLLYYSSINKVANEGKGQWNIFFTDLLTQSAKSKNPINDQQFLVLAHPLLNGFQWTGEFPTNLSGIEILNLKRVLSRAWSNSKINVIVASLCYFLNPKLAMTLLFQNPKEELALWDKLNRSTDRTVAGFFGSDATAKAILWGDFHLKIPSYETTFNIASTHVLLKSELTGSLREDKRKLLAALDKGQFYIAMDLLGSSKGFVMEMRAGRETFPLGSELSFKEGMKLFVKLPRTPSVPFEVSIYRDGIPVFISNSVETSYEVHSAGVYRVIVRLIPTYPFPLGKRWTPWIYTNPIFVR